VYTAESRKLSFYAWSTGINSVLLESMDISYSLEKDERDFISACLAQERWAQKKLYEDHYPTMMSICLRYGKNEQDALDTLHEGFIKVFKNIHKYKPGTSLKSWIGRIMVNTAIDSYRKKTRRRTEDIESVLDVSDLNPDIISLISAKEIIACLQELTVAYRTVFNMYVIEGYPHKEIAAALGITESTSRSNLVKARAKLKHLLIKKKIVDER